MRKHHSKEFKAKVALAALKGDKTMAELSSEFGVHVTMITRWRNEAKEGLKEFFDDYNMERRHSSLGFKTPWSVFSGVDLTDWMGAAQKKI